MTNTQILEQFQELREVAGNSSEFLDDVYDLSEVQYLMDEARDDEHEAHKVTPTCRVTVYVSSNAKGTTRFLSFIKPKICHNISGVWYDYSVDFSKARMLSKQEFNQYGLQPGELGVFELRRVE